VGNRDCLSGEILLAQTLLSAATEDLALLKQVKQALSVPCCRVISDGSQSAKRLLKLYPKLLMDCVISTICAKRHADL